MTMVPELNGRFLFAEKTLLLGDDPLAQPREVVLRFQAENLRKEKTGVHAKVHILTNGVTVAWDQFNIERHQDRQRLINYAHKTLGKPSPANYGNDVMIYDFAQFCDQLWNKSLAMVSAEDLEGDVTIPQRFYLHPFVLEGAGAIMFAPGGRGKSYVALLMGVSIDSGIDVFWPVEIAKVMYINLERSRDSMQRRLGFINRAMGLDEDRPLLFFNGRGHDLDSIGDHLLSEVESHRVEVVILDSISRTGQGKLNADEVANKIADTLNALSKTWLAIAHTARNDDSHIFGSTHFENAADMTIRMHSAQEQMTLGVGLEITKANDVGRQPMSIVGFEFGPGTEGLTRAWPANDREFPELAGEQKKTLAQEMMSYFRNEAPTGSAGELSKAMGRNRSLISGILANDNRFVIVRTGPRGAKFYGLAVSPFEAEAMAEMDRPQ